MWKEAALYGARPLLRLGERTTRAIGVETSEMAVHSNNQLNISVKRDKVNLVKRNPR